MKTILLRVALILLSHIAISQNIIKGFVKDPKGSPLMGVNVISKNHQIGTQSNQNGYFELTIPKEQKTLEFSFIGFKTQTITITNKIMLVILKETSIGLDDIQIDAKSKTEIIKEKAYEVSVLETKSIKNSNINIATALKGLSGINIRQMGGLGSSFEFSMNGLSGKQIKFFIDGIPMENLGSSMSLNNLPTNLIERVEVYKGVVPIYLGSDALGGAINIITKQQTSNYLDVSYSVGSFNTHVASFLGQYHNKNNGLTAKFSSFYNYSDNNYKIDNIDVGDENNNIIGTIDNIERFHDAYQGNMINFQVGVLDRKFTDKLLFGATFSSNRNEIQHALDPQKPYGSLLTKDNLGQTSITYENKSLLDNKLSLKLYAALTKRTSKFIDTVSKKFFWYKKPISIDEQLSPNERPGETSKYKSLFTLNDNSHIINSSLNYKLTPHQHLSLNYTKNYLKRKGQDPIAKSRIPFTIPHTLDKNILAFSYNLNLLENTLKSSLFIKHFDLKTKGVINNVFKNESDPSKYEAFNNTFNKFGFGFASTYKLNDQIRVKASFEKALRLPEGYELFGNGNFLLSNLTLLPEESNNYNAGFVFNKKKNNNLSINLSINGFYRNAKNLIALQAQAIFSKYLNKAEAKIIGFEASTNITYKNWALSLNSTKQNITELSDNGERVKIPNRPLFFGNAKLAYTFNNIFNNNLTCSWNGRYVDDYPLESYTSGNIQDRKLIKNQFSQNTELIYSFNKKKYNISFMVSNITDTKLYDNFNIQQPGRAYYLKLRYAFQ